MNDKVLDLHLKHTGVLSIHPEIDVKNSRDLAMAYTPGVADLSKLIEKDHDLARKYTISGKLVAVVTDGSAVLGLGNIGSQAGLPIVEGKSLLYKTLAGVDAVPLAIEQTTVDHVVNSLALFQNSFGGIHLEDIAAPACFEIEEKLQKKVAIPVYHDDQEGTAIVVLAGLINAAKVANKKLSDLKVVINGMGASGIATARILRKAGIQQLTLVDIQGILTGETKGLNKYQEAEVAALKQKVEEGDLEAAVKDKDVFIGLSDGNLLTAEMVRTMNANPIIFALANPIPEILPEEAMKGGARILATGSSQYPNQVNNILVFPGLFKGILETSLTEVTLDLQVFVAIKLAQMIDTPKSEKFIPEVFDEGVVSTVEHAVILFDKEKGGREK